MRYLLYIATASAFIILQGGCWGLMGGAQPGTATGDPSQAGDMAVADQVAQAKAASDADPSNVDKAIAYAELLGAAYEGGTVERGRLAGDSMIPGALARLDELSAANPDKAGTLVAVQGNLLLRAGRTDEAIAKYEASMEAQPNLTALVALVDLYTPQRRHDEIDAHCQAVRDTIDDSDGDRRYSLLYVCASARPGMATAQALPWASAEDHAFFEEQLAIEQARREAERQAELERQAQLEAERAAREEARRQAEAQAAANNTNAGGGGGGHYSARVSVSSDCDKTVNLFRGSVSYGNPGSGTYGNHSSNSRSSYSLSGDDELCLLDDSRNILSCVKPQDGARLEITESCSGFVSR